ncbi:MAG: DNA polymerase I [Actinobacteria bacterium]|nr:DNA polymerase I [Actinomycetota bacterium]
MADQALHDRLFLLDGSSLAFRAFFALPESISTEAGQPTNALFGLSQMLLKLVAEYRPACLVCAWDARGKTFRDELYDQYKAQRPSMPDSLSAQWDLLPELMEGFGVINLVKPGYEADDILGTLAEEAKRQGTRSVVVTGDRDAMQIVDDDIWVMSTGRGVTDVKIYTPAAVLERFGVTPAQIPDYIALKGDTSDNIPGVPGIGEKTAALLLQQFGSVDELYRRLDEVKSDKRRALLKEHEGAARLSLQLATMVCDVPLEHDLVEVVTQCGYRLPVEQVDAVFERFEFRNLRRRLREITGEAAVPEAAPSGVSDSLVRLTAEPDVGPVAALLEKAEAALAFEARGGADGLVVAAHAGGDACLVAPADAGRAGSLWLLAAHAVVHDAKAQPGFVHAPAGPAFDTAVAAYLLAPERPEKERTLFALAGTDDGARLVEGPAAEAAAATRATLTWRVAEAQRPRLVELGLERLFREVELPLVRVLAQMEAAGVKMDPYRLGEITAGVRDRIDELTDEIHRLAGGPFTIGSPQQLADVLFNRLGLEATRRGKTGYSTDARVLRGLRDQHPIVPAVEEWRELTKLLNTYLEPLPARLDPVTGRLHTTFNQLVAATGRLSSSSPNLQNIPVRTELGQKIRACFVAEEGHKLLVADYSQIELRLMASLSREPALIEAYHRGEDVHRVTAAAVAGIPVEEVTKRQRERAKATNFGIMYGLSAFGLSEQVDIPLDEAKAFIDAYFAKYPKVKEFRERVIAQATQDGYVTTRFGRRRAVPELRSSNFRNRSLGERLAVNTILQGTAADIIKIAMVRVSGELERRGLASRLVLQVHDELVLECREDEVDTCLPLLREAMCGVIDLDPPLEVDIGVGDDWVAAKA